MSLCCSGRRVSAFPGAAQINLWIHVRGSRGDGAGAPGVAGWVTVVIEGKVKAQSSLE